MGFVANVPLSTMGWLDLGLPPALAASCEVFLWRKNPARPMSARPIVPPTAPPTIAPVWVVEPPPVDGIADEVVEGASVVDGAVVDVGGLVVDCDVVLVVEVVEVEVE